MDEKKGHQTNHRFGHIQLNAPTRHIHICFDRRAFPSATAYAHTVFYLMALLMDQLLHPSCNFLTVPASHLISHVIHLAGKDRQWTARQHPCNNQTLQRLNFEACKTYRKRSAHQPIGLLLWHVCILNSILHCSNSGAVCLSPISSRAKGQVGRKESYDFPTYNSTSSLHGKGNDFHIKG